MQGELKVENLSSDDPTVEEFKGFIKECFSPIKRPFTSKPLPQTYWHPTMGALKCDNSRQGKKNKRTMRKLLGW